MNNEEITPKTNKLTIPVWVWILFGWSLLSAIILITAIAHPPFAAFFNRYISGFIRLILAKTTSFLPFSLAELIIVMIPVILAVLIVWAIKKTEKSLVPLANYFIKLIAVCSAFFSLFVFTFGIGYHTPSLYDRFDISQGGISANELYSTALELAVEINLRADDVNYGESGFSVMPYSLSEMNSKLADAYRQISKDYRFVQGFSSKVKPVMLSVPMSYAHTTGIYTYFTGEANLNVDFPDYSLPFTAAHELAHQRGIAREDEANFMAFLAGINSNDTYIEYCAYLNMFEYVASALYNADSSLYVEVFSFLPKDVKDEMRAYSNFFDKYRDSTLGEVSNTINNAYLVANGAAEGTKSYGLVVDLAVAYFDGAFDKKED